MRACVGDSVAWMDDAWGRGEGALIDLSQTPQAEAGTGGAPRCQTFHGGDTAGPGGQRDDTQVSRGRYVDIGWCGCVG